MLMKTVENNAVVAEGDPIATVERILVVEMDHDIQRLFRRSCPLEDFLPPQHPEIILKPSLSLQLPLCGIP